MRQAKESEVTEEESFLTGVMKYRSLAMCTDPDSVVFAASVQSLLSLSSWGLVSSKVKVQVN